MRLSRPLYKQHIGWHLKKLWADKRIRKIENTGLEKKLLGKGIPIVRAEEFLKEKHEREK